MKVAVFWSKYSDEHKTVLPYPEIPDRTRVIDEYLRKMLPDIIFVHIDEPINIDHLKHVHRKQHIPHGDVDTPFQDNGSKKAALYAAGTVCAAVLDERYDRIFCNIRPPGHHANCKSASGFCLYNNIWLGRMCIPKKRVAIVDWDVHHGDGTQSFIFGNTHLPTYFVSIHQDYKTIFPFKKSGRNRYKQIGNSIVRCHNISPSEGDERVKEFFNTILIPELIAWKPEMILISCGFDAHKNDSISQLEYSSELYGWMTSQLTNIPNSRIVSVLEGGYNLKSIQESVFHHVNAFKNN